MRILWDNEVDKYTPLYSTQKANFPAANAKNIHLSTPWRTTAVAGQYYTVDAGLGNTITASCAAIAGHDLTSAATVKIQGHPSNVWTAPDVDETLSWDAGAILGFFSSASKRFWRFYLDDAGNPDGYIEIGRLALGVPLQMPGIEPAFGLPVRSTSKASVSPSGQVYGDRGDRFKAPAFTFPMFTDTERGQIRAMWTEVENVKPVFLVVWEESMAIERPIYARIDQEELGLRRSAADGLLWELDLAFLEAK